MICLRGLVYKYTKSNQKLPGNPTNCWEALFQGRPERRKELCTCYFVLLLLLPSCFSRVRLCATPKTAAHQDPPSLGFSRQEHWSGLPFPSPMHESEKWKWSHSVVSDSSRPHGLRPTRLLCPWDFPGKSTGVGCHTAILKSFEQYYMASPSIWSDDSERMEGTRM